MENKKRSDNPILFAVFINAVVLAAALCVYRPFFETNDDPIFALLAESAFSEADPHIICANIILGYIYRGLYTVMPGIRWHSVLQYVFMFIAYTSVSYLIQMVFNGNRPETKSGLTGKLVTCLLLVSTFYESYVALQFSKTSVITVACGYLILLYALRERWCRKEEQGSGHKRRIGILYVLSFMLLLYGMLLRSSSFKLATLLMLPFGILEFVDLIIANRRLNKDVTVFVLSFAGIACMFIFTDIINTVSYDEASGWDAFRKYHSATVKLIDREYVFLDHNRYSDELYSLGISRNDTVMLNTWQFGDDSVWSTDRMTEITDAAPAKRPDLQMFKGLAENIYNDLLVFNPCVLGLLVIILISYLTSGGRSLGVLSAGWLLITGCIFVYYQYSGRWSHRVVFAVLLCLIPTIVYLTALYGVNDENRLGERISGKLIKGAVGIVLIACFAGLLGNRFDYNDHRRKAPDYQAFFADIAGHKDTLYVADTFTFQDMDKYNVFRPYRKGSLDNFVTVGSWYVNSPVTKKVTGKYGYDNPFDALVKGAGEGKVILVDNMLLKEKQTYLEEHYGEYDLTELSGEYGFNRYSVSPVTR